jgi:hypothetical protein
VDVIEWRKQREALLDRLYILETGNRGRARDERVVAENILRLKECLAELDARIEKDGSSG